MRKVFYISLLLMSFFSAAEAQKKYIYEDTSLIQRDDEKPAPSVEVRIVPDRELTADEVIPDETVVADTGLYMNSLDMPFDSIKNWRNAKDYGELKKLDSLLKKYEQDKQQENRSAVPAPSGGGFFDSILSSGFVSVLLWTIAILFVGFIVYRLFLTEGVFQRKTKTSKVAVEEVVEEVITKESDFDRLIRVALQNGNYRQAVRYQYLRTLHTLANRNFIELSPDKTNYQYVREITNRDHQNDFAGLTLNYEYVWYGEFEIDQQVYQKIETGFINLNQKLKI